MAVSGEREMLSLYFQYIVIQIGTIGSTLHGPVKHILMLFLF